ncbi:UDP-galactose 4'-epimerase [Operophtera brumata]|uniref:UDP-galactose 4'-epimerase n=1 Tax=Operophtera brumata TaxID=104452 RepID=A0A0L7KV37_OPEBR|nr:UDP-galactose 4'-epimerase [Operophtera brumata]
MLLTPKDTKHVYNLGTGRGVSVKQLVEVFEKVTNTKIPLKYEERRLGDITAMYAPTPPT